MNKFHVGEKVIVNCRNYPQANGEAVVLGIITGEEWDKLYNTGSKMDSPYCYDVGVTVELVNGFGSKTGIVCSHFGERALLKRPKPSTESFSDLMKSLKEGTVNA